MQKKHNSPLAFSEGFKRYHTLDFHLKQRHGKKMCKVVLSAGMTCPNRDGTKGWGGCTFCSGDGGGEFAPQMRLPLAIQFAQGAAVMHKKWPNAGLIGYFQAFSNTHTTPQAVAALLEQAVALPQIEGVRLATRADCLDDAMVAVLAQFGRRLPLSVELGLQTVHDATAQTINRCHSFAEFLAGYQRLKAAQIPVCVHLINGLPNETEEMMLESAAVLGRLCPEGVKIHMLHVIEGSAMGRQFRQQPFSLLTKEEYVSVVCRQLVLLPPETVIERLTGDADAATLIAPEWTRKKLPVINAIDKFLFDNDLWQGKEFEI